MSALAPFGAGAVPYASMVIDARTGEVIESTNADARLHPASLTKMMTLYIAFEAINHGEISPDTLVTISEKAANEPPSKLGLRAGQQIPLRFLIRAAAVKSANDAATAIGEAISGSEAAFARRMNRTALALGMTRSTFKNAHGLTEEGHLSTAHDMTLLGRHLFYDYPEYYNLFSRRTTDAGLSEVANTNRRFLDSYEGADGIKTGYTRAAGFNLVASAERRNERIIATVFGGHSVADRNARIADLLDMGFDEAPSRARVVPPEPPPYMGNENTPEAPAVSEDELLLAHGNAGKIVRMTGLIDTSPRPRARGSVVEDTSEELLAAIESDVAEAIALAAADAAAMAAEDAAVEAASDAAAMAAGEAVASATAEAEAEAETLAGSAVAALSSTPADAEAAVALADVAAPPPRPEGLSGEAELPEADAIAEAVAEAVIDAEAPAEEAVLADAAPAVPEPPAILAEAGDVDPSAAIAEAAEIAPEPGSVQLASAALVPPMPEPVIRPEPEEAEIVTRVSTSGGRHWGLSLGAFPNRHEAEKALITMALADMEGLSGSLRRVVQRNNAFEANFMGMSEDEAGLACRRIEARGESCTLIGP